MKYERPEIKIVHYGELDILTISLPVYPGFGFEDGEDLEGEESETQ